MKKLTRILTLVVIFFACSSIAPAPCADTWYVDRSIPASGDGTSWGSAFATIQDGIDAAATGDTVIVAEGTYVENIRFRGKNIVLTSTGPLDPEVVANTIIDGNQAGSVVEFNGTEDASCVLSGFTIRNGKPAGPGGGIHGYEGLATIRYNVITGNSAERGGGGLAYCNGMIEHNVISKNFVTVGGGAGLFSCYATIRNNLIMQNSGEREGGGMKDCWGSIVNNVIVGNSTTKEGGGISWCSGEILNNTIVGNSAANDGGGVHICTGTIMNCIVWGNSAPTNAQISSSATPTYCCVQGGAGGAWNINQNPLFAGPDDYGLSVDSPCIDTGYNAPGLPQTDIAGMPRIVFGGKSLTVDIGAYEFMPPDTTSPVITLL